MPENLMENLNPEQLKAVRHNRGPLLIVAGAGTGKTTVITQRIAYIIEQGWAKPDEILALTFTEKAAGEMEERVGALLPVGYFDLWISTFHSFGERILKEHSLAIGLSANFKLLNEFEQWALVKKNLDKFALNYYRPLGNPTKFIQALIRHFSRAKDENISPADYLEYAEELKQNLDQMLSGKSRLPSRGTKRRERSASPAGGRDNLRLKDANVRLLRSFQSLAMTENGEFTREIAEQEIGRINEVANAYHVYQQLLLDNNALDFGDLINYSLKLFTTRPAILNYYKNKFKYILLDEFQDTNWAQYDLIKHLVNDSKNLVVVGDDDQSIYKFRGASLSNILQFKKDFPRSQEIILTKNYRSRQNILDLSYNFIQQNNPNRLEYQLKNSKSKIKNKILNKKLVAQNKGKGEIEVIAGETLEEEVKSVIEKIVELKIKDKKAAWNDFAILVRANDSAKDFINELDKAQLPYIFGASRGLYLKPLIIDVISYLKLLDNYHESRAMYRVLNWPIFNFTYQELVNLNYLANRKAWSLFEVLTHASELQLAGELLVKINQVLSLIKKHTALVKQRPVSEVFFASMNDSGYLKHLTTREEQSGQESINLLNQFMARIKRFEAANDDRSVKAFLAELNMEMEAGEEGQLSPDLDTGPEAIRILTVHGAKGLEFKYVFIANLVDKRFPTTLRHEQIELPDALVKEILPEGDIHLEEERRLFYVAMTRAKDGLFLSWAEDYGGARKKKPSIFLAELGFVKNDKFQMTNNKSISNDKFQMTNNVYKSVPQSNNSFSIPSYFSYTQLAAFSNCPYQYRFAHIIRVPVAGKEQFSFGKTLHLTLQKLFSLIIEKQGLNQADLFGGGVAKKASPKIKLDEVLRLYDESWIDDWYESKNKKEDRRRQGKEILTIFYEKHNDNWPQALYLEKGFSIKLPDNGGWNTVKGNIDRIDQVAGGIKIIDYKTGQPKDKLTFEEKEQLLIYQLAASELFSQPIVSLAFYYLDNNSEVEFLGSADDLAKVKEKVASTIAEMKQGQFPPRPSQLCKFCDFKDICEFRRV